ncbi:hypothetical protein ACQ4M5_36850 [Leptolyngbya sp. AN10]
MFKRFRDVEGNWTRDKSGDRQTTIALSRIERHQNAIAFLKCDRSSHRTQILLQASRVYSNYWGTNRWISSIDNP